jgi:sec-independent protein translocase protein TatA
VFGGRIGWPELIIVLVIVLLVFGAARLRGLGKATGEAVREFKEETAKIGNPPVATETTDPKPGNPPVAPPTDSDEKPSA